MPPSDADDALRAVGLWRELGRAYDEIETCLAAQAWNDLAEIAARIAVIEHALEDLGEMGVRAHDGAACTAAAWREADELAQALAARLPAIERAARTARDAAAAHLARVRVARDRTSTYRPAAKVAPRFTSRVA
jgi:hypothetical protein